MSRTAIIRQLHIERFRGIESLKWNPASGMNVILGGGDVGKTTILEAIVQRNAIHGRLTGYA